ncbi:MAG: hypothetical protein ABSH34_19230 [Verrucomicrobiota bacterium]|jgi:hypothetical protein
MTELKIPLEAGLEKFRHLLREEGDGQLSGSEIAHLTEGVDHRGRLRFYPRGNGWVFGPKENECIGIEEAYQVLVEHGRILPPDTSPYLNLYRTKVPPPAKSP